MESFPFSTPEAIGIGAVAAIALWIMYRLNTRMIKVLDDRNQVDQKLAVSIHENTEVTRDTNTMIRTLTDKIEKQNETIDKQNSILGQHSEFLRLLISSQLKKQ